MAITKLQVNWASVAFAGSPITKVTSMAFDPGGSLIKFKADVDRFPTTIVNVDNEPTATVTSGDVANLYSISPGTAGTLTGTLNDALLATGGAIVFSMVNAVFRTATMTAPHAQFASATGSWDAFSNDGQTSPLSFTRS